MSKVEAFPVGIKKEELIREVFNGKISDYLFYLLPLSADEKVVQEVLSQLDYTENNDSKYESKVPLISFLKESGYFKLRLKLMEFFVKNEFPLLVIDNRNKILKTVPETLNVGGETVELLGASNGTPNIAKNAERYSRDVVVNFKEKFIDSLSFFRKKLAEEGKLKN